MNSKLYVMPLGKFIDHYNGQNMDNKIALIQTARDCAINDSYRSQVTSYIVKECMLDSLDEAMFALGAECGLHMYDVSNCNPITCAQILSEFALCYLATDNVYTEKINDFDMAASEFYDTEFLCKANGILCNYLSTDEYMAHFYENAGIKNLLSKIFKKKMSKLEQEEVPTYKKLPKI